MCELAGCAAPTRHSWVRRGLIEPCRGGCTATDLIELYVLAKLMSLLGPRDTGFVWPDLRSELRKAALTGGIADVVVDLQSKRAALVQDAPSLLAAVRTEHPVRVIPLGDEVAALRGDFRRLVQIAVNPSRRSPRAGRRHADTGAGA